MGGQSSGYRSGRDTKAVWYEARGHSEIQECRGQADWPLHFWEGVAYPVIIEAVGLKIQTYDSCVRGAHCPVCGQRVGMDSMETLKLHEEVENRELGRQYQPQM